MGHTRRQQPQRGPKGLPNTRSRTRLTGAPLFDPASNTVLLNQQLRALGLYAAHTLGDGNCLFRALCDQLYGTHQQHLELRKEICEWIAARKERYAPFVDDERGIDEHLRCMRRPGTYGGHLELSAFAHCKRRNVKVIQPGLVYVIEWNTGIEGQPAPNSSQSTSSSTLEDSPGTDREKRRLRREKLKEEKDPVENMGTVYVAYHDWEHFSSVRNEGGPHEGIPNVVESLPPPDAPMDEGPPATPSKHKMKQAQKTPKRGPKAPANKSPALPPPRPPSPSRIPLPPSPEPSRSSSPTTQLSSSTAATSSTAPSSFGGSQATRRITLRLRAPSREGRSPKRSFDESERDGLTAPVREIAARKKQKQRAPEEDAMDEDDVDVDGNSTDSSALSCPTSSASASSVPPPPTRRAAAAAPAAPPAKPLTRRQLKKLGLPKPRPVGTGGANKIKIPGGRHHAMTRAKASLGAVKVEMPEDSGEWQQNGTGRLDVRGFRELRI